MKGSIVITGGGGFVGKYLVSELLTKWPEAKVVVWDRKPDKLPAGVVGVPVDILEGESYRQSLTENQPEWLVHLAAFSSVGDSFEQEDLVHRVNVEATRDLLQAVAALSPKTRVLAVSSADIYGEGESDPVKEKPLSEAKPKNPYAQSKLDMEKVIEKSFNDFVLRVRPFPHIGPGQRPGFVTADFASQIAAIEKGKQEPVIGVGNLTAQRDFTDVRDVVRAYRLLMEKGNLGEVYHVASGRAVSIQHVLDQLLKMSTADITVEKDPNKMRPVDIPIAVGDASKLKQATGWQTGVSLEQSLKDVLNWWRKKT